LRDSPDVLYAYVFIQGQWYLSSNYHGPRCYHSSSPAPHSYLSSKYHGPRCNHSSPPAPHRQQPPETSPGSAQGTEVPVGMARNLLDANAGSILNRLEFFSTQCRCRRSSRTVSGIRSRPLLSRNRASRRREGVFELWNWRF